MATLDYKKLRLHTYAAVEDRETPEARFWRKFRLPVVQKLITAPTHLEFCPTAPHDLAVTVGSRISIFDYASSKEKRAITKFKEPALSGSYRSDGKLMVAGGIRPMLQIFDMSSRAVLRTYKGHAGPIHFTRFTSDNTHVVSASDDRSIRYWDLPSGNCVSTISTAHEDYIRCGAVSRSTPSLVATGSYDHTVRLWDLRASTGASSSSAGKSGAGEDAFGGDGGDGDGDGDDALALESVDGESEGGDGTSGSSDEDVSGDDKEEEEEEEASEEEESGAAGVASGSHMNGGSAPSTVSLNGAIMAVDHGEPVTQVLMLPGGSGLLTAGSNYVRCWDMVSGGRLLHTFSNHTKLITAMCLDGSGTRLLTGGLDSLVKVYELSSFSVTHTMRYDAPILSLTVSPDNSRIVAGCTNSTLTIKQRLVKVAEIVSEQRAARALRGGTYRYFLRGQATVAVADDVAVSTTRKPKLRAYDKLLKSFEYGAALDAAIASFDPVVVTSVFRELIARDGLHVALSGRSEETLEPILSFLVKYVVDPRFSGMLVDVTNAAVDMYTQFLGTSASIDALFMRLHSTILREIGLGKELLGLQGALDLLMAASTTGDSYAGGEATSASAFGGSELAYN